MKFGAERDPEKSIDDLRVGERGLLPVLRDRGRRRFRRERRCRWAGQDGGDQQAADNPGRRPPQFFTTTVAPTATRL
jgi:hypothetical protein